MSGLDEVFGGFEPKAVTTVAKQEAFVDYGDEATEERKRRKREAPPPAPRAKRVPKAKTVPDVPASNQDIGVFDFVAYLPGHGYIFRPTREIWPAASVDGRLPWPTNSAGKKVKPSRWLDLMLPVEQMVWHPNEPEMIRDKVMQISGWAAHAGTTVFNLYRPPEPSAGDPMQLEPWRALLVATYPEEADHIERYLAFKVQYPGEKINHALVLGGSQGIGKDTLLEPVKAALGPWNWQDISPAQMLGRFNGWAKCVMLRINEARDLGEVDRFAFYDHSKTIIAAPPDVIRVDEKNLREHYVANVCGVIITTNHRSDGLYLPADDRRHFVAWSERKREEFDGDYWTGLYAWYAQGGIGNVVAHLRTLDLSGFDAKAPPPKTPAFWAMVQAGEAPESGELRDAIEAMRNPQAMTLGGVIGAANDLRMYDLVLELQDRKNRRSLPHKLERVGYTPVRNPDADDGLFKSAGKRQAVYALKSLPLAAQIKAARSVVSLVGEVSD